ncbi:hypothetical protein L1887_00883 [Cichorium endivia]|nr:hypothetical protein L1887_00883 [Cichorium endivia]
MVAAEGPLDPGSRVTGTSVVKSLPSSLLFFFPFPSLFSPLFPQFILCFSRYASSTLVTIIDIVILINVTFGTLLGALTRALIGQETESGFVRGSAIGAISGAIFSIEVFKSSLILWKSNESRIGCLLYLIS